MRDLLENHETFKNLDTITISWGINDIYYQAEKDGVSLNSNEAIQILQDIKKHHDAEIGINWDVISMYINDFDQNRHTEEG